MNIETKGPSLIEAIPLITSMIAIVVSSLTLGWTIYRDAIRKPKFRVSVGIKSIVQAERQPQGPFVFVEALNMGPIPNRAQSVFARAKWLKRRLRKNRWMIFVYPDYSHPGTTPAGSKMEVGDTATFIFPYAKVCFLGENVSQVGVSDGFGTIHWAPSRQMRKAQEQYRQDFPAD
jgi:hypothetical protein